MNWLLARPLRGWILLAALASLVLNLALLAPSIYMLQVFDRVFASRSLETLAMLAAGTALALAVGGVMDAVRTRALGAAGRAIELTLAPPALHGVLLQAAAAPTRVEVGVMADIALLRNFLASPGVHALFDAPWLPLYLALIAALHPLLGAAAAAAAVALAATAWLTERLTRGPAEATTTHGRAAAAQVDELVRHAELVVGLGMQHDAMAAWRVAQAAALDAQEALVRRNAALGAATRLQRQAVQVAVLGLGAVLVIDGHASPGIMIAATLLLARALQPVEHLLGGWKSLVEVRAAWQRLGARPLAPQDDDALELPAPRGLLELDRVALVVAAEPAPRALLKNVSLVLQPGQCLGLIGASGSGKTTLARLVMGLVAPTSGSVRLDGAELAPGSRARLGPHLGYLPQRTELFAGTAAQNIARLGAVDAERVVAAARLAGVHELILGLPQGYDTRVGAGGLPLSGGQRQRLALARAVYGAPRLVVLDEPDANLDAAGEAALRAAIEALKRSGACVVLAAHRMALMRHAELIAVMDGGALRDFGPRERVLAALGGGGVVRALHASAVPAEPNATAERGDAIRPRASGPDDTALSDVPTTLATA